MILEAIILDFTVFDDEEYNYYNSEDTGDGLIAGNAVELEF